MLPPLWSLLHPQRLTEVVDIGANPAGGDFDLKGVVAQHVIMITLGIVFSLSP
jgi:hypothetical protein